MAGIPWPRDPHSRVDVRPRTASTAVLRAVNGETGHMTTLDYRWVDCLSAYTYLADLDLGIVMKPGPLEARLHPRAPSPWPQSEGGEGWVKA